MSRVSSWPSASVAVLAALSLAASTGCGMVKKMGTNSVASMLAESGTSITSKDDPELVREAIPFALTLYESILESTPKHKDLLIATCSSFTQYAYGFLETDAEALGEGHHEEAKALKARALKMYVRAKGYCLRAMDVRWKGMSAALIQDPVPALARAQKKDVPLLYWTAAAWGAAASLGLDQPELVIDLPTVRALAERALALDETWNKGALHELMITIDSLPEVLGGSADKAKAHFEQAVKIQKNLSPGPYVALASGVMVSTQDRNGYEKLLKEALAKDPAQVPETQLVTLITQRRARAMLAHIDEKFSK